MKGACHARARAPLEIWRISVQVLLPAPNGAYTGCKAAGRGEERYPGGSGADASPKKAPPPDTKIAMSDGDTNT